MQPDTQPFHSAENSYIFDPESPTELSRLISLDKETTQAMHGPLAGIDGLPKQAKILDLACGPGRWVLDVAFALPDAEVAGLDISRTMIDYANTTAQSQKLTNASFGVMNILQGLGFADNTIDLINARLLIGFMKKESWPWLFEEVKRLLRPGGIFRLSETDEFGRTTSPAFETLAALAMQAGCKINSNYSVDGKNFGIEMHLARWFRQAGYQDIQIQAHAVCFDKGTPAWGSFFYMVQIAFQQLRTLLLQEADLTEEEFDRLYQQMRVEMQQGDFCGLWRFLSVWGKKPLTILP